MRQRLFGIWGIVCVAFLATACTPAMYVSQYDQVTDEGVTALQKKVAQHLATLMEQESPACTYGNHEAFYVDVLSDMDVLITRADVINNAPGAEGLNEITIGQLDSTKDSLETLKSLHRDLGDTCISSDSLEDLDTTFTSNFRAILAFEFAKKREAYAGGSGDDE